MGPAHLVPPSSPSCLLSNHVPWAAQLLQPGAPGCLPDMPPTLPPEITVLFPWDFLSLVVAWLPHSLSSRFSQQCPNCLSYPPWRNSEKLRPNPNLVPVCPSQVPSLDPSIIHTRLSPLPSGCSLLKAFLLRFHLH